MKRTLYTLLILMIARSLMACTGQVAHSPRDKPTVVTASHSIYIEGGVLKVFSDDAENMLYLYVRPRVLDRWLASGGGGGNQTNRWHHETSVSWALGDENGMLHSEAPRRTFSCLFDSQRMLLTLETGTYAVRRGDFVVIVLDENWRPSLVKSGINALQVFDLPQDDRIRLISRARRYYDS